MINSFLNYNLEYTADGSPTLRVGQGESMHHSGGAASESKYIYETALDFFYSKNRLSFAIDPFAEFKKDKKVEEFFKQYSLSIQPDSLQVAVRVPVRVMSMGFGLGYNELIFAVWALRNGIDSQQLIIDSFEIDEHLYLAFNEWLNKDSKVKDSVYDKIMEGLFPEINSNDEVKGFLKSMLAQKKWQQRLALTSESLVDEKYSVILYDAFSSKTNPELWSFDFIDKLLKKHTQKKCVFSTYACRGELKRVLEGNGFTFVKRQGFKGKRDASMAFRV